MTVAGFPEDVFRPNSLPAFAGPDRYASDPYTIRPLNMSYVERLERRIPHYESAVHDRRLLGDIALLSDAERQTIFSTTPSIQEGRYIDDVSSFLKLACATFIVDQKLVPTPRSLIAEEMSKRTGLDFAPFAKAAIVRLGNDLVVATNNFHYDVTGDFELMQNNFKIANIFSSLRARVMGLAHREPRYIVYADSESHVSGTLVFVDPSKHPRL